MRRRAARGPARCCWMPSRGGWLAVAADGRELWRLQRGDELAVRVDGIVYSGKVAGAAGEPEGWWLDDGSKRRILLGALMGAEVERLVREVVAS